MRVLNIITGLNTGGAETMLLKLSGGFADAGYESGVVSLLEPGPIGPRIEALGIPVFSLGMKRGLPSARSLGRLVQILRSRRPDVVMSWLYHADLMALVATRLVGGIPLVWNLRCSYMDFSRYRRTTAWTVRLCSLLSRFPDAVMSNSAEAIRFHSSIGYRPRRTEIIPNGFDTDRFRPDAEAAARLRARLDAAEGDFIVGMAGRFDYMKDHATFFKAAGLAHERNRSLRFVLCGDDVCPENGELQAMIRDAGLGGRVHLFGRVEDMPGFMAGLDALALSSRGEAFPNVIGEALCCEVPCVSTEVGDAAAIVGSSGYLCPAEAPEALADRLVQLAGLQKEERREMGRAGRRSMIERYSIGAISARYMRLLNSLRK